MSESQVAAQLIRPGGRIHPLRRSYLMAADLSADSGQENAAVMRGGRVGLVDKVE